MAAAAAQGEHAALDVHEVVIVQGHAYVTTAAGDVENARIVEAGKPSFPTYGLGPLHLEQRSRLVGDDGVIESSGTRRSTTEPCQRCPVCGWLWRYNSPGY